MRTRSSENPKPATAQKKTPAKKLAGAKAQIQPTTPMPAPADAPETLTPKSSVSKRTAQAKATPPAKAPDKVAASSVAVTPISDSSMETPVEKTKVSAEDDLVTPPTKKAQPASTMKRVARKVVRKKVAGKTSTSAKAAAAQISNLTESDKDKNDGLPEENTTFVKNVESPTIDEPATKGGDMATSVNVEFPAVDEAASNENVNSPNQKEQAESVAQAVEDIVMIQGKGKAKLDVEEFPIVDPEEANRESDSVKNKEQEDPSLLEMNEAQQEEEERENMPEKEEELQVKLVNLNEVPKELTDDKDNEERNDEDHPGEGMVKYGEDESFIDPCEDDFQDDGLNNVKEVKTSEHMELTAVLKERKLRREFEVFVCGLDRDVVDDDVKNVFAKAGEVVEVRLLKDPSTSRNRGFAFVRFANKEHANWALSEMKNPVICGKRCATTPSEDNDVLFLGNICNTWTKEAIKQKLNDYRIEGVESVTVVQDPRHEGLSRGFCFVQFACHADAMVAYKRLQKPDAVFGHAERSAKVAFAEPLREPDPKIMAKVKSVFVDGLPAHWDEDHVRENFKCYGEIERITLARNMPSAKRKDFGFVDFSTHEAAIACIKDVNRRELGDGSFKARVRARLSNPMPKTQAVKGGMCGGFRIGRGGVVGRGFGRGNRPYDRPTFQYGRPGFYQHGRGHFSDPMRQYPDFNDSRQFDFGGRSMPSRGPHLASSGSGHVQNNFSFSGPRQVIGGRGLGRPPVPIREPLLLEDEGYARPFMGSYIDDPYNYSDRAPVIKRPLYMADQDPGYMELRRVRPRFDYSYPAPANHYSDAYGAGSSMYSSGYYGPDYGAGQYPPFQGNDHSFRGGYQY